MVTGRPVRSQILGIEGGVNFLNKSFEEKRELSDKFKG